MSNYDRFPAVKVHNISGTLQQDYDDILAVLKSRITRPDFILAADTYPGVRDEEILPQLRKLNPDLLISMEDLFPSPDELTSRMQCFLTEDRVFGRMCYGTLEEYLDAEKLAAARRKIREARGLVIVYGFGASLAAAGDLLVYFDMARWEIQLRYRAGMGNYHCDNGDEDILRKFKRGYFVEWRLADRHKAALFERMDYVVDTNHADDPKMITGDMFREGLRQTAKRPFRTVPYFDPGVWGGQWMKEKCNLDPKPKNYAWSFDGVPEENSLLLEYPGGTMELPAQDLVLYQPQALLGAQVYARFGAEFPIRFDFLDTMGGQNLSLQVHPTTDYIHRTFGMAYTQDESYYLLDAGEDACVYLGLREGMDKEEMLAALHQAQQGGEPFDAERYINRFPAKKHDHFLIPAGTIHCSGRDAMVLEISATPYIFTFKLWDWGRLGLDGKPRPINIEHGSRVIQWNRTTDWVRKNLVNAVEKVSETDACTEEHTGLHELEFLETRRYWIRSEVHLNLDGGVTMMNLVEGEKALVISETNAFEPFEVHYAETFIVPADAGSIILRNPGREEIGVLRAYVRTPKA